MPSYVAICEKCRGELTEIACGTGGATLLSSDLQAHLDVCESCRGWFEGERLLFSAIDAGVRSTANAEVPATLLPRVRARLDERSANGRGWVLAAAMLAAAALVLVVSGLVGGRRKGNGDPHLIVHNAGSGSNMPAVLDNSPEPIRHRTQAARPVRTRSAAHLRVDQSRVPVEVLVLVPRAQKAAVDAALLTLRHEKAGLGALLVAKDKPAQGNELSPLKIPEMVIQPLVPIGDTQETTDGSARF